MTRLAALFALVLFWDAPATNCDGSPLTDLDHYEVPVFRGVIVGWEPCTMEDGTESACPFYNRSLTRMVAQEAQLGLADPGPGEVLGWESPEAIDSAGRSSAECGP